MSLGFFVPEANNIAPAERLVLISHADQIEPAEPGMLVAADWLTWRRAGRLGRPCLHLESFLRRWPAERGEAADFPDRAFSWLGDGDDPTMFMGQSLGHLFTRQNILAANAYERLYFALTALFRQTGAKTLVVHGLRSEYAILGPRMLDHLLRRTTEECGLSLRRAELDAPPRAWAFPDHDDSYVVSEPVLSMRDRLRDAFAWMIDGITRLTARNLPVVYFLQNPIFLRAVLGSPPASGFTPALPAQALPKTWAALTSAVRSGIRAVSLPSGVLDDSDRARLNEIAQDLRNLWQAVPAPTAQIAALRLYAEESFLPSLPGLAAEAKRYRLLTEKLKPAAVVVGDATNASVRACMAAAKNGGALVCELMNGVFLPPLRYDSRRKLLDRQLTWGPMGERWAAGACPEARVVRTGYPTLDGLPILPPRQGGGKHALILPLYVDSDDVAGLQADVYAWLAESVSVLQQRGYQVRVKVHGGPPNIEYYRAVLAEAGLDAPVIQAGMLLPHMEWADLVVGPVNSGAMTETLAAGRSYYAVAQTPGSCDLDLLAPLPIARSPAQLAAHLDAGLSLDRDAALQHLCARKEIPHALTKLQQVLADELARNRAGV